MDRFATGNTVTAPVTREPTATWACGEVEATIFLSRRGARCDEVPAGAPRIEQARARCASAPYSLERPPPRTCSEEQSALPPPAASSPRPPAGGTYDAGRAFSLAIHASIRASSTSSGTAPAPRTASWNRRTSKAVPSAWVARFRSSRICSSPTL
jgi:hypothetical protein